MFGWVDHAAALDGFLSGMLYVPYALARLSSSVVCRRRRCRSLALPLLLSAVGAGQALVTQGLPGPCWRPHHGTGTSVRLFYPCCCLQWGIGRRSVTR